MDHRRNVAFRCRPLGTSAFHIPSRGPGISGYSQYLMLGITYPVKSVNKNMGLKSGAGFGERKR
jgi:hypothetical protein